MPEVSNDPFPAIWGRVKHTLGMDISAPKGGVECLTHAFGVVPFIRNQISAAMSYAGPDK